MKHAIFVLLAVLVAIPIALAEVPAKFAEPDKISFPSGIFVPSSGDATFSMTIDATVYWGTAYYVDNGRWAAIQLPGASIGGSNWKRGGNITFSIPASKLNSMDKIIAIIFYCQRVGNTWQCGKNSYGNNAWAYLEIGLTKSCVEEGNSYATGPFPRDSGITAPSCCAGIEGIANAQVTPSGECNIISDSLVCANCGNWICGPGENECNCLEDCSEIQTGQIFTGGQSRNITVSTKNYTVPLIPVVVSTKNYTVTLVGVVNENSAVIKVKNDQLTIQKQSGGIFENLTVMLNKILWQSENSAGLRPADESVIAIL